MTDASYFELKSKIFGRRTQELNPMLTGTIINWDNSWMLPLGEFALQCMRIPYDVRQKRWY